MTENTERATRTWKPDKHMTDAHCPKHFIGYCPELSKECPYCRISELEAKLKEKWCCRHLDEIRELKARLAAVEKLPEKWRNRHKAYAPCADELEAALRGEDDE